MSEFLREHNEKRKLSAGMLGATVAALVIVICMIGLIFMISPAESEEKNVLEGAYLEGTPEFEEHTRNVIISTNSDRLMQSMTGLGNVNMHISGSIYNRGERSLSVLEVRVGVVDSSDEVIKEKKFILIPNSSRESLLPGKTVDVTVIVGGFSREDDRANVRWKVTALKLAD